MFNDRIEFILVQQDLGGSKPGAEKGPQAVLDELKTDSIRQEIKITTIPKGQLSHETPNAKNLQALLETMKQVRDETSNALVRENFLFVLSGDHSTAAGTIAGVKSKYEAQRVGVVWFDAHSDIHSPYTSYSHNVHGMPLGIATGEDNFANKRQELSLSEKELWNHAQHLSGQKPMVELRDIAFVGLRDQEIEEKKLIENSGCLALSSSQIDLQPAAKTTLQIKEHLNDCDVIYISFDIDILDPDLVPGTGTPAEGGPELQKMYQIIADLSTWEKVVCFEMTEVNPLLDKDSQTTHLAAQIIQRFLLGINS